MLYSEIAEIGVWFSFNAITFLFAYSVIANSSRRFMIDKERLKFAGLALSVMFIAAICLRVYIDWRSPRL